MPVSHARTERGSLNGMSMSPEQAQAYQAGRNARERGSGEYDNPLYGIIDEARELRQYWRKGWKSRDTEMGGKR